MQPLASVPAHAPIPALLQQVQSTTTGCMAGCTHATGPFHRNRHSRHRLATQAQAQARQIAGTKQTTTEGAWPALPACFVCRPLEC